MSSTPEISNFFCAYGTQIRNRMQLSDFTLFSWDFTPTHIYPMSFAIFLPFEVFSICTYCKVHRRKIYMYTHVYINHNIYIAHNIVYFLVLRFKLYLQLRKYLTTNGNFIFKQVLLHQTDSIQLMYLLILLVFKSLKEAQLF